MIVNCPGCDAPHESIYSAGQHAWKSEDDDHSDYDDLDPALVAVMTHNDVVDAVDPAVEDEDVDAGDDTPPDSPTPDSPEQPDSNTPEQSTATDGGRQAPPTPDLNDLDDGDDDGDELPDRFVPVEDYLDACREDGLGDAGVDELRDALDDYDVVDVEATTASNLKAYRREEVIDA